MRVLQLKEVAAMGPGEKVPAFKAQIKEIKEFHTGQNSYGAWSIQKLTLMDGSGLMQVKIFDHPEFTKEWRHVWIYLESGQGEKGEIAGMKIVDDDYRGRVTRMVEVKREAAITQAQAGDAPAPAGAPAPARQQMPPPQTGNSAAPAPAPAPAAAAPAQQAPPVPGSPADQKETLRMARLRIGKAANGLILAFDAALYIAAEVKKRHPSAPDLTSKDLEAIAVHLSIGLEREGLTDGLPSGPMNGK